MFSGGKTPYPGIHPLELCKQLETGYRMEKPHNAACSTEMYVMLLQSGFHPGLCLGGEADERGGWSSRKQLLDFSLW